MKGQTRSFAQGSPETAAEIVEKEMSIPLAKVTLTGDLQIPAGSGGLVIFAHGSGSSRHSPRNQYVAQVLRDHGSATLLFDLLTESEEAEDPELANLRFNIPFLANRLVGVTQWILRHPRAADLPIGYFGSSTGAAAALVAAAEFPSVTAIVSRGGRPDLAFLALPHVKATTLLIVGEYDQEVVKLNRRAFVRLDCPKQMLVIPRATHLFEEPGTLEDVAKAAADWFSAGWREHPTRDGAAAKGEASNHEAQVRLDQLLRW